MKFPTLSRWSLFSLLVLPVQVPAAVPDLTPVMEAAAPGHILRGTVISVETVDGATTFSSWHYKNLPDATDFWPASTIKIYTAVAALEKLHALGLPLETTVTFEHQAAGEPWVLDSARSMPEMLSEVWRRSSNEDYTLLLRFTGIDSINSQFLTPGRGFTHSSLMRGYWLARPFVYKREERQRLTLRAQDGRVDFVEHLWSGHSWSAERGATVLDAQTGNMASTRDLAECLRRIVFHDLIPESERFRISPAMVGFLKHGGHGFSGLETNDKESGPYAWNGAGTVFPKARFYHKAGRITDEILELAVIDDRVESGRAWVICLRANSGQPAVMNELCRAVLTELKKTAP